MVDEENSDFQEADYTHLLDELGRSVVRQRGPRMGARPVNFSKIALEWMRNERNKLIELLCSNEKLYSISQVSDGAKEKMIRMMVDILSAYYTLLPCGTIAEILLRDGLSDLCHDKWKSNVD